MPTSLRLTIAGRQFVAMLDDGPTVERLLAQLPLRGTVRRWGAEVALVIDLGCPLEPHARNRLVAGEVAYWPVGATLSFFCGATPLTATGSDQPVAASAVTPIGRVDDPTGLVRYAESGMELRLEIEGDSRVQ
ncbi:MAG: cyclophilin-like fold protein [Planctomycetota bacterium]